MKIFIGTNVSSATLTTAAAATPGIFVLGFYFPQKDFCCLVPYSCMYFSTVWCSHLEGLFDFQILLSLKGELLKAALCILCKNSNAFWKFKSKGSKERDQMPVQSNFTLTTLTINNKTIEQMTVFHIDVVVIFMHRIEICHKWFAI